MCLIFLSFRQHPTYDLVIAANRDEFYQRKTAPAAFWQDHPHILGGRDLEAGGTWMGLTTKGHFSMLTNYRDPFHINPSAPSRGHLVSKYLEEMPAPASYLAGIEKSGNHYNGFNLVAGTPSEIWYYSNYGRPAEKLEPGFYGLSNHLLNSPWPKIVRGKERIAPVLQQRRIQPEELFELLYDETRAQDQELPDTGIGLERERALSSMFIKTQGYGSRSSTVVLITKDGHVQFSERVYDVSTFQSHTANFEFDLSGYQ